MTERSSYVIFCDDVRLEVSNKRTFVGVFGTEMFIDEVPSILPRLTVVSTLICSLTTLPSKVTIRLKFAGEEIHTYEIGEAEISGWQEEACLELTPELEEFKNEEPPKIRLHAEVQLSPFVITTEGRLTAYIETEDGTVRAGSLKITLNDPQEELRSELDASNRLR